MNIISGLSALASLPAMLSSGAQRVSGDSDGDHGQESIGKSNFMNAVTHALDQTLSGSSSKPQQASHKTSSSTDATAQDPQVALQGFLQNLFSSLSQASVNSGNQDGAVTAAGKAHGSHMTTSLQNLLQQLSSSSSSSTSGTTNSLSQLDASFQNLVTSISSAQGLGASAAQPTLQTFLQNLMQNVGNGQNISGTIVSTQA